MRTIFVLGAGASADAGVPMMRDFFERADRIHADEPDTERDAFELVGKARARLQLVQSKARFDIRNLESVFAAFEMASLLGRLGNLQAAEVDGLVDAMRRVIVVTIERCMLARLDSRGRILPPQPYGHFGALIRKLVDVGHTVSILTFNYDCGVEMGLLMSKLDVNYGFDATDETQDNIELLKLHGSLNWARCSTCGSMQAHRVQDVVRDQEAAWRISSPPEGPYCRVPFSSSLSRLTPQCQHGLDTYPVIVPPTINKTGLHMELQPVWRRAAARLAEAHNVFIVGYSWPDGDSFFHQLYALGTVGEVILSNFWVCDPNPQVRERFHTELLGQQALDCLGPPPEKNLYLFNRAIHGIADLFNLGSVAEPGRTD